MAQKSQTGVIHVTNQVSENTCIQDIKDQFKNSKTLEIRAVGAAIPKAIKIA
jgi:hypothetical protein